YSARRILNYYGRRVLFQSAGRPRGWVTRPWVFFGATHIFVSKRVQSARQALSRPWRLVRAKNRYKEELAMMVAGFLMLLKQILPEVAVEIAPDGVNVVGIVLRVV